MEVVRPRGMGVGRGYDVLGVFGGLVKRREEGEEGEKGKEGREGTKLMVNFEYSVAEAEGLLREGKVDFVGFGRGFIYNPVSLVFFRSLRPSPLFSFFLFGVWVGLSGMQSMFVCTREREKAECGLTFLPTRGEENRISFRASNEARSLRRMIGVGGFTMGRMRM